MSDYQYPRDEFDDFESRRAPVGVHRAPRGTWSRFWPFLLVAALGATVAIVAIWMLSGPRDAAEPIASPPAATEPAEPGDDALVEEPIINDDDGAPATEPEAEPEPAGPEPGSLEALLAAADLGASIRVYNDTAPSGEAARGATALTEAGFTSTAATNYPGNSGLTATSVWYEAGNQDTALAVARVLGIPEDRVVEHATQQGVVNVILRGALQLP